MERALSYETDLLHHPGGGDTVNITSRPDAIEPNDLHDGPGHLCGQALAQVSRAYT